LLGVWRSARVPEAETRFLVVPIRRVVAAAAGAAAAAGVAAAVAAVGAAVEAGAATGQTFGNGPGHPSDLRKHLLDCLGFGFPALSLAVEAVTAASAGGARPHCLCCTCAGVCPAAPEAHHFLCHSEPTISRAWQPSLETWQGHTRDALREVSERRARSRKFQAPHTDAVSCKTRCQKFDSCAGEIARSPRKPQA
jgi:hypothetical protein